MNKLQEKILKIVKKIPEGKFLTYKEVAKLVGKPNIYRYVANILAKNREPDIPCHRVIKNDNTIGGYLGSEKNSWKKLALLLKEGVIAVMPTDTIYGICASAFKKDSVEKVYRLRKRNPKKPCIILISKFEDLKDFGVKLNKKEKEYLQKIWPAKISVILDIKDKAKIKELEYLHRGTNSLAFRLPRPKWLRKILEISGPLIAPSANWEGMKPARTINEAKKYFDNKVVYFDKGKILGKPSRIIRLKNGEVEIIRK
jgi:L-threonylcarbamoyladenylate synthase